MPWWGWIIFGAVLLGSELMVVDAAFYLVFIGVAAIITGLVLMGGFEMALWVQWLLFAVLALVSMVLFRQRFWKMLRGGAIDYESGPAGESLRLNETLEPGASCRMNYRGTTWTVLNDGPAVIQKGESVEIKRVDGLKLIVRQ